MLAIENSELDELDNHQQVTLPYLKVFDHGF